MASAKSSSQPATDPPVTGLTSDVARARRRAIVAGQTGDIEGALELIDHAEPAVRTAALGALAAGGRLETRLIVDALGDDAWTVRRRACELAGRLAISRSADIEHGDIADIGALLKRLVDTLADRQPLVSEAVAWALGELTPIAPDGPVDCVEPLAEMATRHPDPLCREAAVAALGAIGAPSSLEHVLSALGDKPPIRRRATIALAAFADPRADAALNACLKDRDWQVRQAAEDILGRMD